jgi:hypothetical protein
MDATRPRDARAVAIAGHEPGRSSSSTKRFAGSLSSRLRIEREGFETATITSTRTRKGVNDMLKGLSAASIWSEDLNNPSPLLV